MGFFVGGSIRMVEMESLSVFEEWMTKEEESEGF
jgi:hypothetical protein